MSDKMELIKEWYDGYTLGNREVFCPWDVVSYLSDIMDEEGTDSFFLGGRFFAWWFWHWFYRLFYVRPLFVHSNQFPMEKFEQAKPRRCA